MRKIIFLIVAFICARSVNAQCSFLLADSTNQRATYNYTISVGANSPMVAVQFSVTNTSSSSKYSRVHKTILYQTSGHDIYFAYNQTCYSPITFYSGGSTTIAAGQTFPANPGFYGLRPAFDANGFSGTSIVRYTVYDSLNHSDSINLTITYNVGNSSVISYAKDIFISEAMPCPATENIAFNFKMYSSANLSLEIYNELSEEIKKATFLYSSPLVEINISNLKEGVYYCRFLESGRIIATRKFLVIQN